MTLSRHNEDSPLAPYRILDLTEGGCMICARMLGDLGADVIRVEPPGGSLSRTPPFYNNIPDPEKSLFWFAYNTNKRGITLDISKAKGQEIFKKLVNTADVVVESFEPGYMEKFGLGYADLCKVKPDIIMTSITLFGQSGPKSRYKGSELTAWASGSYLYICGNQDRPPTWISFPQAFLFGGSEAAVGTMTALWHRQITGEGQYVDVSIQECAISPSFNALQMWDVNKAECRRLGGSAYIPATGVTQTIYYRCKDGYVLILVQGGGEPHASSSRRLVEWMDENGMAPDWLKQVDWGTDYDASKLTQDLANRTESEIAKFVATKTKKELYEEGGINRRILIAPVSNAKDICENQQLESRGYWLEIRHTELDDSLTYCGPFLRLSETPIKNEKRAPLIGEHNHEIYGEEMGLTSEDIAYLKQDCVI